MQSTKTGRAMSGVAVAFLVFDSVAKLMRLPVVLEASAKLGLPEQLTVPIGLILLASTVLYVIPRTAVFGAVLLTGYLGGAVCTHLRVGEPLFSHVLFPTYMGALLWGGLWLRDGRVRAMFTTRSMRHDML
jgi:hypothetical protein